MLAQIINAFIKTWGQVGKSKFYNDTVMIVVICTELSEVTPAPCKLCASLSVLFLFIFPSIFI